MRKYTLESVECKTGKRYKFKLVPMAHDEACIFKSKFSKSDFRTIEIVEVISA